MLFMVNYLRRFKCKETPRCLLAQQFTDRIEVLDVVAEDFKHHCDRNAE